MRKKKDAKKILDWADEVNKVSRTNELTVQQGMNRMRLWQECIQQAKIIFEKMILDNPDIYGVGLTKSQRRRRFRTNAMGG